jgi:hypothetical protein
MTTDAATSQASHTDPAQRLDEPPCSEPIFKRITVLNVAATTFVGAFAALTLAWVWRSADPHALVPRDLVMPLKSVARMAFVVMLASIARDYMEKRVHGWMVFHNAELRAEIDELRGDVADLTSALREERRAKLPSLTERIEAGPPPPGWASRPSGGTNQSHR